LNPLKVRDLLGGEDIALADDDTVEQATGAPVGFAGPLGLSIAIIADQEVTQMVDAVCGANKGDTHFRHVAVGRDFSPQHVGDIRLAAGGDPCAHCGSELKDYRGIEVGHVFYLGQKYSDPMGCTFLDKDGKKRVMEMGCYGIGITRVMAAAVEQNHDEHGIVWPVALAPYTVVILPLGKLGDPVYDAAEGLYRTLQSAGVEVVLDDRRERPGVKFKDAELLGFPYQIVVGRRGLEEGVVELKSRQGGEATKVGFDDVVAALEGVIGS